MSTSSSSEDTRFEQVEPAVRRPYPIYRRGKVEVFKTLISGIIPAKQRIVLANAQSDPRKISMAIDFSMCTCCMLPFHFVIKYSGIM